MACRGTAGSGPMRPGWPHGHGSYLPRGGLCDAGEPGARHVGGGSVIPLSTGGAGAEQVWCGVTARSPARPGEGRPRAGRGRQPGKRPACRACYTRAASASTASGDVSASRRGSHGCMTIVGVPSRPGRMPSPALPGQHWAPDRRVFADWLSAGRRLPGAQIIKFGVVRVSMSMMRSGT